MTLETWLNIAYQTMPYYGVISTSLTVFDDLERLAKITVQVISNVSA